MKCIVLHRSRGRMRIRLVQPKMTLKQADILEYYLRSIDGVESVKVYDRTCDTAVTFSCDGRDILDALSSFSYAPNAALAPENTSRALNRELEEKLVMMVFKRALTRILMPSPIHAALTWGKAGRHIRMGMCALRRGRIEVSLLDAVAITVSLLRNDHDTASSIMFLLKIGELLEEWTHKKSVNDLARAMSLNVDKVWRLCDGTEVSVPIDNISAGDEIVVRTGSMIPLDGIITKGDAMVNQSSMTGESIPVHKTENSYVYAGTVIEEGECVIRVAKASGSGRYDQIVKMIERSEKLKSTAESKASHLADKLVPYSLGGTLLTYLLTRNISKAISILMVDFSCALKLAMPIAVLSAMREGRNNMIAVKGGKFLEAAAEADTIVFDKTGTLTYSCPKVVKIIPFGGRDADEMLRLAACLEEHYPHSMANAVVSAANEKQLHHEEMHTSVNYVVAHGIASTVNGEKVIIGSHHFVFQDELSVLPKGEEALFDSLPEQYSHLYMAIAGELAAVICIEDPLREEAPAVLSKLHSLGVARIVMMTGDSEKAARAIAAKAGVDEYHAEVLPEDKAEFIRSEHAKGHKVIMVGDGVNDSPALSEADAGIAMGTGAAIAREVSDITLSAEQLDSLVTLRLLSMGLMRRIQDNYRFIMGFNTSLILLGVFGVLTPPTSALLHNISTVAVSLRSMTDLLDNDEKTQPLIET